MDKDEEVINVIESNGGMISCLKSEFFGVFFMCLMVAIVGFSELTNGLIKTSLIGIFMFQLY